MIVRLVPVSVLATLLVAKDTQAFSLGCGILGSTLSVSRNVMRVTSSDETVTDCIQEAVEILEDDALTDTVRIQNDMPEPGTTKDELLNDIQDVMEAVEDENAAIKGKNTSIANQSTEGNAGSGLVDDIVKKFQLYRDQPEVTVEEAAVSASLYMNPATEKIAQNLVITWEPNAAKVLLNLEKVSNPNRPLCIAIVGIPGSGKSTSSEILAALMGDERAIVMPMDGFHIPLAELAEFPNAADAIYRRGAPDTFDAAALADALTRIAYGDDETVTIPGFDHAVGDPIPNQHTFKRDEHRIVICEGLYLLHDDHGWENIKSFFDWTIYIDADVDACIERLKERNKCIPGYTPEEIAIRCDAVDRVNAETARDGAYQYASQIVSSGASR